MKRYFRKLILFALPLTVLAFCLITVKATIRCDYEVTTAYGFPLLWTTPGVTSLSTIAYMLAFIVDLAVYFGFFAVISATALFDKIFAWKPLLFSALLWFAATLVGGLFTLSLTIELYADLTFFDYYCPKQITYQLFFGFPFSR